LGHGGQYGYARTRISNVVDPNFYGASANASSNRIGLNELPQPSRTDLELLLKQAEKLVQYSVGPILDD